MVEYDKEYYERNRFERYLEKARRDQVIASAESCTHETILDIGPGLQTYEKDITDWKHYIAVEPNHDLVSILAHSVPIIQQRFEDTKILDQFDFIIISSLLHMIEDCDLFLQTLRPLCHEKTLVHINVPNAQSLHRYLGYYMGLLDTLLEQSESDKIYNHYHNFTLESLEELLERNGFHINCAETYMMKPFSDSQMSQLMDEDIAKGLCEMAWHFEPHGCEIKMDVYKNG